MLKKINSFLKKYWIILLFLMFIGGELGFFVISNIPDQVYDSNRLAQEVIGKCLDKGYKPTCYDQEIPELMDKISMEQAFEVASVVQKQDDNYGYCHTLGHELSAREAAKDIDNWSSVIRRCPTGICSNGCLHGAAQERFRQEVLNDDQLKDVYVELKGICDPADTWKITGLEQSECYHGLGHLSIYVTGAEVDRAVKVCDEIGRSPTYGDFRKLCYEGLFMQIFQPLDSDDIDLVQGIAPKKEGLRKYCSQFNTSTTIEACWQEGFTLYQPGVLTAQGTVDFCDQSGSIEAKRSCFNMIYYVKAQSSNYDQQKLSDYCGDMPKNLQSDCFGYVANAIIHGSNNYISRAVDFCNNAKTYGQTEKCFDNVLKFAKYNIKTGAEAFTELCNSVPIDRKEECIKLNVN